MTFRLTDPAFLEDPTQLLAQMRAEGPLVRVKVPFLGAIWMTTTDTAARKLLKSPEVFRRDPEPITGRSLAKRFWWMPRSIKPLVHTMIAQDDPEHLRLRRLVDQAFARAPIDELRPRIEGLADGLLDKLPTSGPVDIATHYTRALPFLTICALLGIPETSHARLLQRMAPLSQIGNPFRMLYALSQLGGVQRDFRAMFAQVREAPGEGLISALVHAEAEGEWLSEQELLSTVILLFMAGHETTVHLINNALVGMAQDRALLGHFKSRPEARHLMIEEFVRFYSPVMMTKPMFVAEDNDILGAPLKKGDTIAAFLLGANHDPDRVSNPATLAPDRRPNAHMGFGFGPHVCLGMQLARLEAVVALDRLFARFPDLALSTTPVWLKRPGIRAPAGVTVGLGAKQTQPEVV